MARAMLRTLCSLAALSMVVAQSGGSGKAQDFDFKEGDNATDMGWYKTKAQCEEGNPEGGMKAEGEPGVVSQTLCTCNRGLQENGKDFSVKGCKAEDGSLKLMFYAGQECKSTPEVEGTVDAASTSNLTCAPFKVQSFAWFLKAEEGLSITCACPVTTAMDPGADAAAPTMRGGLVAVLLACAAASGLVART